MESLFEIEPEPVCICVPFSSVRVEPWCPVHDPHGKLEIPEAVRLRDERGKPLAGSG